MGGRGEVEWERKQRSDVRGGRDGGELGKEEEEEKKERYGKEGEVNRRREERRRRGG